MAREIEDAGWKASATEAHSTAEQARNAREQHAKSETALIERVREALASKLPGDSKLLELRERQFYMAILVARLVGLYMGQSETGDQIRQRFTIVFHHHHLLGTNKVRTRPAPISALER